MASDGARRLRRNHLAFVLPLGVGFDFGSLSMSGSTLAPSRCRVRFRLPLDLCIPTAGFRWPDYHGC
mgnify:CR=1 FL=1